MNGVSAQNLADLPHVLVVDDDDRIRQLVFRYLSEQDFIVCTARDAKEGEEMLRHFEFDILVVDIMMPGENGLDFTRRLRKDSDLPVLLLTALGETDDRIAGFETGADDYLPKPFEPRELVLRLQAILKRRPRKNQALQSFRIGRWSYDPTHRELHDGKETVRLTDTEDTLLRALASKASEAVSRDELAALCGMDAGERTIDVQVTRLRRKIEDDPKAPRHLQTVRGKGYLLRVGV